MLILRFKAPIRSAAYTGPFKALKGPILNDWNALREQKLSLDRLKSVMPFRLPSNDPRSKETSTMNRYCLSVASVEVYTLIEDSANLQYPQMKLLYNTKNLLRHVALFQKESLLFWIINRFNRQCLYVPVCVDVNKSCEKLKVRSTKDNDRLQTNWRYNNCKTIKKGTIA